MTQEDYRHPIEPPPWRVQEWGEEAARRQCTGSETDQHIAVEAAQWGADQELEACCEYVYERLKVTTIAHIAQDLRTARRPEPKPPRLKEQALQALSEAVKMADDVPPEGICSGQADIICHALEQLDD
jgi:hypothetical protein